MRTRPGRPEPLGATWDGAGTNFALASEHATAVELCLFERGEERERILLSDRTGSVWHTWVEDVGPGQHYGYRVHGPYSPGEGHRFNPAKLVIDPCTHAVSGGIEWRPELRGGADPSGLGPEPDPRDSAPFVPRGVVVDVAFDWQGDRPPAIPWADTVLYECHVRGATQRHPAVADTARGRYRGLASPPMVDHLRELGVTAVQLMPVQHFVTEQRLERLGLVNYWGYNPLVFSAPTSLYASGDTGAQVAEFQEMVRDLHAAGLEVILDVVYNHTAEAGADGPTLSLRGIDNAAYYRLDPEDPRRYVETTGCGNALRGSSPLARRLLLDSLRWWVRVMHVDGFRFDLAPAMARSDSGEPDLESLFGEILRDPELQGVKWIAEPWDTSPEGHSLGAFPAGFAEWNCEYRDTVRRFWRGDPSQLGDVVSRLAGSHDIFDGRGPLASVNFVTCHDGFTLHDLVSYERKHNEANGEANNDGHDADWSCNWGAEGPTASPDVERLRHRARRNLLATLALSQGVPMLSHGDELARTLEGNNNAYCHDGPLTWLDWEADLDASLLEFARAAFRARARFPALRRKDFLTGEPEAHSALRDVHWLRPDGCEMGEDDWANPIARAIAMWLPASGAAPAPGAPESQLLLLLNAAAKPVGFRPPESGSLRGHRVLSTAEPANGGEDAADGWIVPERSLLLLESEPAR